MVDHRPGGFGLDERGRAIETQRQQRHGQCRERYQASDPGDGAETGAMIDDEAAEPGADGIAEIEGGDVEG